MTILIDTHIFLWLIFTPQKVSKHHLKLLENGENRVFLSSISIAEIVIKRAIGSLKAEFDVLKMVREMDIEILDFDGKSAVVLGTLSPFHKDPFDRMIISQAISFGYPIITVDKKFNQYRCSLL